MTRAAGLSLSWSTPMTSDPWRSQEAVVGIDLGVTTLATLSTGETIEGPKSHKAALGRLRRANKAMARKKRGSRNARRAKQRLARLHRRVAAIRRDATHKLTTRVTKTFAVICRCRSKSVDIC